MLALMNRICRRNVYLSRHDFSNSRQRGKKIPHGRAQILMNPASREAFKSRFPPRYFAFFRIPGRTLVKSWIPKIPFQTLLPWVTTFELA